MTAAPARDVDVQVEADAWTRALPGAQAMAREAALAALGSEGGDLVILLTDDESLRELNQRFRGRDRPTNVLSFPAALHGDGRLGDVALAFGVCESEAQAQGKSLEDHLRHLVVHGVLHLLGHDHEDDAQAAAMEAIEISRLARLGVPDPYGSEPRCNVPTEGKSRE